MEELEKTLERIEAKLDLLIGKKGKIKKAPFIAPFDIEAAIDELFIFKEGVHTYFISNFEISKAVADKINKPCDGALKRKTGRYLTSIGVKATVAKVDSRTVRGYLLAWSR